MKAKEAEWKEESVILRTEKKELRLEKEELKRELEKAKSDWKLALRSLKETLEEGLKVSNGDGP